MVFPAVLWMTFCLSPLIVSKQYEAQVQLNEVLTRWEENAKKIKTAYFEIECTQKDSWSKKQESTYLNVHIINKPDGECCLKAVQFDIERKPLVTWIFRGAEFLIFTHAVKDIHHWTHESTFTRQSLLELSVSFFPALPIIATRKEIECQNRLSFVKTDKHYTWIRFVPESKKGLWTAAQVGALRSTHWSPFYFPIQAQWYDVAGNLQTWVFKTVVINDDNVINDKVFYEEEQLLKTGWKLTKSPTLVKKTIDY